MTDLNANTSATRKFNPLTIVASVLFLVFVVFTILPNSYQYLSFAFLARLDYVWEAFTYGFPSGLSYLYFTLDGIVFPLLGLAAAVLGLVSRKLIFQPLVGAALFVGHFVLFWVVQAISRAKTGNFSSFYFLPDHQGVEGLFLTLILLAAILLSGLAWLSSKNSISTPNQVADTSVFVQPEAATVAPVSAARSYDNLPLFALIGAFVIPLAGIILGHLSLSYMKKGQLSEQNKGMAKAGLILGYVFVGLSLLFGMFFAIIFVVAALTGAL